MAKALKTRNKARATKSKKQIKASISKQKVKRKRGRPKKENPTNKKKINRVLRSRSGRARPLYSNYKVVLLRVVTGNYECLRKNKSVSAKDLIYPYDEYQKVGMLFDLI